MDLTEWVDRLKAECPEFGNRIFLLDDLLLANPKDLPTAFVMPLQDESDRNRYSEECHFQTGTSIVSVRACIKNTTVRDAGNTTGTVGIETLKQSIRAALRGWKPTNSKNAVDHVIGQILDFDEGVIWWEEQFIIATQIQTTQS